MFLDLGKIIFGNTVRDVSMSAFNAYALYNLEVYCSCAKTWVLLVSLWRGLILRAQMLPKKETWISM